MFFYMGEKTLMSKKESFLVQIIFWALGVYEA